MPYSWLYHIICHAFYYLLNIKQNLGHTWLLRPHTLGKLIIYDIYLSIKQNFNYVWLLGPHALRKLILTNIFLNIKQILSHAWLLGPQVSDKLIFNDIFLSVEQNESCLPCLFLTAHIIHLYKILPSLQKVQFPVQVCDNSLHCWYLFNSFKLSARYSY